MFPLFILRYVIEYLDIKDICTLPIVCKDYRDFLYEESIIKYVFWRMFSPRLRPILEEKWAEDSKTNTKIHIYDLQVDGLDMIKERGISSVCMLLFRNLICRNRYRRSFVKIPKLQPIMWTCVYRDNLLPKIIKQYTRRYRKAPEFKSIIYAISQLDKHTKKEIIAEIEPSVSKHEEVEKIYTNVVEKIEYNYELNI